MIVLGTVAAVVVATVTGILVWLLWAADEEM